MSVQVSSYTPVAMVNLLQSKIRKLFPFIIKCMEKDVKTLLHSYLV